MTAVKTRALTIRTFAGKVIFLLLNMLRRFVITFLPRSVFNFMAAVTIVILEPKKIKSVTISVFYPSICHEVMGLDAIILTF